MFKKHKITCFMTILLFVLFSGLLVACTDNENKAQLHSTQPIEIFSVEGPLDPVNPGGPVVGITLKNISSDNIVSLNATLELERTFSFDFDVSAINPLLPGNTIYAEQYFIYGGFAGDALYPLQISGTFQDGTAFAYTEQVMIEDS